MKLLSIFLFGALVCGAQTFSTHTVTLNWTYPLSDPNFSFNIWRANGACPVTPIKITTKIATGIKPLTYVDSSIVDGQSYCYQVTATYFAQESSESDSLTIVIPAFAPMSPKGLKGIVTQITIYQ